MIAKMIGYAFGENGTTKVKKECDENQKGMYG
jgi:hypothetical protein